MKNTLILVFISLLSYSGFSQNLFVNEVLAINKSSVKNKKGKFKDCIEIYNSNSTDIDISGYFLSDVKVTLKKWAFPQGVIIKSKGYVLVWADNKPKKNTSTEMHTNFKLSSKKETIRLSDKSGKQIHKLKCKRQFEDISFGLAPDGSKEKRYMNPSLGKTNLTTAVLAFDIKLEKDSIELHVNSDNTGFIVYNKTGSLLKVIIRNKEDQVFLRAKVEEETGMIHIEDLSNGRYEMQIGKNIYRIVKN
jgi:hypothetical protein